MQNTISAFWTSERSLSVLLWVLAITLFVATPLLTLVEAPTWERIVISMFFSLLVVSGVLSAWSDRRTRRLVLFAGLAPLSLLWIELVYHPPIFSLVNGGLRLGMVGLFAAVLLGRVLAEGRITSARIKGAIAVYLLIGVMFQEAYRVLSIASPGSLSVHASNPMSVKYTAELLYFSFSTLTTAGYGDIVPIHPLARSMANGEAIVGQLYIVLLIGRLLTLSMAQLPGEAPPKP